MEMDTTPYSYFIVSEKGTGLRDASLSPTHDEQPIVADNNCRGLKLLIVGIEVAVKKWKVQIACL